jgi:hypothetical protein
MKVSKGAIGKLLICGCVSLVLVVSNSFAAVVYPVSKSRTIFVKIKLNTNADVSIEKAALKYNKRMAYSFMLDDGYRSAFLCAYPLLNGGEVSAPFIDGWQKDQGGDGSLSKGLYFSDGCGNSVPFRMGIAINAASLTETPENRGSLSWSEVKALYNSGWDILNHSYHHSTKHGTDYSEEVRENGTAVFKGLGFEMTQFIVPGGEGDLGYQDEYAKAAFENGIVAVGTTNGAGPVIKVDRPVNLNQLVYQREFVKSTSNKGSADIDQHLRKIDSLLKRPEVLWYNEFTHGVGNDNLWDISLTFPDFKYYMTSIAERYGASGADNLWMAPWQEVYEYIWLRDRIKINTKQNGEDVTLEVVLPDIPASFRHGAISFNIKTASTFSVNSQSKDIKVTTNGKGKHSLLNIQFTK